MAKLRLFIEIDGEQIDAFEALSAPARGDRIWIRTAQGQHSAVVANVEHQWDHSTADTYGNQDVILHCSTDKAD